MYVRAELEVLDKSTEGAAANFGPGGIYDRDLSSQIRLIPPHQAFKILLELIAYCIIKLGMT